MIVAAPGSSSRLHGPAAELTGGLSPGLAVGHPRSLWHRAAGDTLVLCRGFDIPRLVSTGVVDIGITGYDTCVGWSLASGAGLMLRALPAARTSFVTYCTVTGRDVRIVYTEYPALTQAWLAARADAAQPRLVPLRGSTEGVTRADPHGAGVPTWSSLRQLRESPTRMDEVMRAVREEAYRPAVDGRRRCGRDRHWMLRCGDTCSGVRRPRSRRWDRYASAGRLLDWGCAYWR
ncbi:hypothetical protein ABUL04_15510 [Micromonospora harpali]|uniref:ATP phosphoribosyltransferase catalytic domain-containing protein n=1 Tax=Micromonospora harpali TaxID=1490225 RepID=A0ABW1HLZ1_9ACTN